MDLNKSDIETLHRLGLTLSEAKVYLALARVETADAKDIAKSLDIAKCEVYRVISSLEKSGLVEKIFTIPTVYRTVPVEEATQILLQNKNVEYQELQKNTKELVANIDRTRGNVNFTDGKAQNIIISEGKTAGKRLVSQLFNTKRSFETISTWRIAANMLSRYSGDLIKLMENGVKVRALTDTCGKNELESKFLAVLKRSECFEIRYAEKPLTIKMAIRDREDVNVCFFASQKDPNFWSNNPIFLQITTNCFEYMWNEADPKNKRSKPYTILPALKKNKVTCSTDSSFLRKVVKEGSGR